VNDLGVAWEGASTTRQSVRGTGRTLSRRTGTRATNAVSSKRTRSKSQYMSYMTSLTKGVQTLSRCSTGGVSSFVCQTHHWGNRACCPRGSQDDRDQGMSSHRCSAYSYSRSLRLAAVVVLGRGRSSAQIGSGDTSHPRSTSQAQGLACRSRELHGGSPLD
jgi:hypothetical protein